MSPRSTKPVNRRPLSTPTPAWPSSCTRVTPRRSTRQAGSTATATRAATSTTTSGPPDRATPCSGTTRDHTCSNQFMTEATVARDPVGSPASGQRVRRPAPSENEAAERAGREEAGRPVEPPERRWPLPPPCDPRGEPPRDEEPPREACPPREDEPEPPRGPPRR